MIFFHGLHRSDERIGHARHLGQFFRCKFVKVFVERIAGINPVLNAVQAGKQERGETPGTDWQPDPGYGTRLVWLSGSANRSESEWRRTDYERNRRG